MVRLYTFVCWCGGYEGGQVSSRESNEIMSRRKLSISIFHPRKYIFYLLQRDTLNLHRHALGQLRNSDTAAGRLMRKELFVGSIHLGEVGHVSEEDLCISR